MVSRFLPPRNDVFGSPDPFGTLHREVNRVFDEVFRGFPTMRNAVGMGGFAPDLEVLETAQGLELVAELPGMAESDVDLKLEGDLLTLSGEKKEERREERGGVHLSERSYGQFQRAFRLPFQPDPAQVTAQFERGVLRVALPRPAQQAQAPNRIQIRSGGGGGAGGDAAQELGQMGERSQQPGPAAGQANRPGGGSGGGRDPSDNAARELGQMGEHSQQPGPATGGQDNRPGSGGKAA